MTYLSLSHALIVVVLLGYSLSCVDSLWRLDLRSKRREIKFWMTQDGKNFESCLEDRGLQTATKTLLVRHSVDQNGLDCQRSQQGEGQF